MGEAEYVTQSDERTLLGAVLVSLGLVIFIFTYIVDCTSFLIFLVLAAGAAVLFLPVPRNLLRLEGRSVLITGCDTGFGHELAKRLSKKGATVYAGCLLPDGEGAHKLRELGEPRLHVVPLDVTSDESVEAAVRLVKEQTGDLWAVVNNAGVNYLGDVDIVGMEAFRRIGEINLYGMVRVAKACLPLLKKSKGRVVNVTSVKGLLAFPICSHYNISKFGGEAFSDCLRMEMRRFGVHVILVEPCNFGGITSGLLPAERDYNQIWEKMSAESRQEYGRQYIDSQIEGAKSSARSTYPTMEPVLEAMESAVRAEQPQYRYHVGGGQKFYDFYKWLAILRPVVPTTVMDKYLLQIFNLSTPQILQKQR